MIVRFTSHSDHRVGLCVQSDLLQLCSPAHFKITVTEAHRSAIGRAPLAHAASWAKWRARCSNTKSPAIRGRGAARCSRHTDRQLITTTRYQNSKWRRHDMRINRVENAESAADFGDGHVMMNGRRDKDPSQALKPFGAKIKCRSHASRSFLALIARPLGAKASKAAARAGCTSTTCCGRMRSLSRSRISLQAPR